MDQPNTVLEIGTVLSDRYQILDVIGHGGFGTVYLARQINMNRDVAVKVLPAEFLTMENVVERFRREAKLASRLCHPNTITLFDYGRDGNCLFIVMELLKGKDLSDLLQEQVFLEPIRVIKIVSQVLRSLREAHSHGIVHRDLKPENIFVCQVSGEEDVVKVLDFGIAKFISPELDMPTTASRPGGSPRQLTRTGSTIGTPAYMSPEQAAGDVLNNQSDLYSLGVIMYELVSGRLPFGDEDPIKTMRAHLFEDPPPLRIPGVTGTQLERVIMTAMAKEREHRFESAEQMLRALEAGSFEFSSNAFFNSNANYSHITDSSEILAASSTIQPMISTNEKKTIAEAETTPDLESVQRVELRKVKSFNNESYMTMQPVTDRGGAFAYSAPVWDWEGREEHVLVHNNEEDAIIRMGGMILVLLTVSVTIAVIIFWLFYLA